MIAAGAIGVEIANSVRRLPHVTWRSDCAEIVAYRTAVLNAQTRLCAYCKRPIYRDEVGFRELDHVLPKSRSPEDLAKFDPERAKSNDLEHRRHTHGYAAFMYVPENLVISCKLCNSTKGAFDALADRAAIPDEYPMDSDAFMWVHPYFDAYDDHIRLVEGHLYEAVERSAKGNAVIKACGLDNSEGLRRRLLDSYVFGGKELVQTMINLVLSNEPFVPNDICSQLHDEYQVSTVEVLIECLGIIRQNITQGSMKLSFAMAIVGRKLGIAEQIMPARRAA